MEPYKMKSCIAFIGGRSAGHILPALALAHKEKNNNNREILFLTSTSTLDLQILQDHTLVDYHFALHLDNVPQTVRGFICYGYSLLTNIMRCFFIFLKYRPIKLVSTGGYLSIPAILAAWLLRIPIELYELNAIPGKAIKFCAWFATSIKCTYDQACVYFPTYNTSLVSYPIHLEVLQKVSNEHARKKLGWQDNKKVLCVLGGSQGSSFINHLILNHISMIGSQIHIIHQTGEADYASCKEFYAQQCISHHIFPYHVDLVTIYAAANLIVCRAGAGTLAEILFFKKTAIVIPLEIASTHHQVYNALAMQKKYPHLINVLRQHQMNENPKLFTHLLHQLLHLANHPVDDPIHKHNN